MLESAYPRCPICRRRARLIKVGEAAEMAAVCTRTIYRWREEGKVHAIRTAGGRLRVCLDSLFASTADNNLPSLSPDPRLELALSLIEEQHRDPDFTLDKLAQRLSLSAWQLSRLINRGTGVSFREHLMMARMRKAAELLGNMSLSIKQVATEGGYKYASAFARHFKRVYGQRPGDYRRRLT